MLNIILQNLKVRFGMKLMKVRILYIIHFFIDSWLQKLIFSGHKSIFMSETTPLSLCLLIFSTKIKHFQLLQILFLSRVIYLFTVPVFTCTTTVKWGWEFGSNNHFCFCKCCVQQQCKCG